MTKVKTLTDLREAISQDIESKLEAIDEAVNLLMDHHLRPYFFIEDDGTYSALDDDIYSHLHKEMKHLIVLTQAKFAKFNEDDEEIEYGEDERGCDKYHQQKDDAI
tara:strand:+ start:462 stop:779 length:318 start_codon:yes stop_codon:yes gene_type:complete